jgi:hypothetical protein
MANVHLLFCADRRVTGDPNVIAHGERIDDALASEHR